MTCSQERAGLWATPRVQMALAMASDGQISPDAPCDASNDTIDAKEKGECSPISGRTDYRFKS